MHALPNAAMVVYGVSRNCFGPVTPHEFLSSFAVFCFVQELIELYGSSKNEEAPNLSSKEGAVK